MSRHRPIFTPAVSHILFNFAICNNCSIARKVSNNKSRVIAALLLLLFLSFQGGRSLCYHTHIFGDKIISHSHPFNNPNRQHNSEELISIAQIGLASMTDNVTPTDIIAPFLSVVSILIIHDNQRPVVTYHRPIHGRAPPTFHTALL